MQFYNDFSAPRRDGAQLAHRPGFEEEPEPEEEELDEPESGGRSQRRRSTFSALQVHLLEAEFFRQRYVSPERRAALARFLGLSQQQVKIWFQNRRYKTKTRPESGRAGRANLPLFPAGGPLALLFHMHGRWALF